jgi:alkylation response protein AidB-like acyl-CoA dehydrogenase
MDVGFTDQELAFRAEVLQFLAESFDDDLKYKLAGVEASPHLKQGMLEWQGRLNARGWLAPGWPEEYGGKNWSITQHFIFSTELGMAGAPPPMPFGVTIPTVTKSRKPITCHASSTVKTGGARVIQSRRPVPIWPLCSAVPSAMATTM